MKIYPVVFACERDLDLIWLQREFIKKIGAPVEEHTLFVEKSFAPTVYFMDYARREGIKFIERPNGFTPWPSIAHCRCAVDTLKSFILEVKPNDEDYILSIDSDAFLVGTKVLENVGKADLIGFHFSDRLTWIERLRKKWANIMGSFILLRVGAVRKMVDLPTKDANWAADWLSTTPKFGLAHDMYLPLVMELSGASTYYPDTWGLYCEGEYAGSLLLKDGCEGHSVLHLYGDWNKFAGFDIGNKGDVARIMKKMGLPS